FNYQNEVQNYKKAIPIIANKIPDYDKSHIQVTVYHDSTEIPPIESLRKEGSKALFILDDLLTKNQQRISELMTYGRPLNLSVIYISQSYFALDRYTITLNANFFIFFKLNKLDLQHVWQDLCSIDFKEY